MSVSVAVASVAIIAFMRLVRLHAPPRAMTHSLGGSGGSAKCHTCREFEAIEHSGCMGLEATKQAIVALIQLAAGGATGPLQCALLLRLDTKLLVHGLQR